MLFFVLLNILLTNASYAQEVASYLPGSTLKLKDLDGRSQGECTSQKLKELQQAVKTKFSSQSSDSSLAANVASECCLNPRDPKCHRNAFAFMDANLARQRLNVSPLRLDEFFRAESQIHLVLDSANEQHAMSFICQEKIGQCLDPEQFVSAPTRDLCKSPELIAIAKCYTTNALLAESAAADLQKTLVSLRVEKTRVFVDENSNRLVAQDFIYCDEQAGKFHLFEPSASQEKPVPWHKRSNEDPGLSQLRTCSFQSLDTNLWAISEAKEKLSLVPVTVGRTSIGYVPGCTTTVLADGKTVLQAGHCLNHVGNNPSVKLYVEGESSKDLSMNCDPRNAIYRPVSELKKGWNGRFSDFSFCTLSEMVKTNKTYVVVLDDKKESSPCRIDGLFVVCGLSEYDLLASKRLEMFHFPGGLVSMQKSTGTAHYSLLTNELNSNFFARPGSSGGGILALFKADGFSLVLAPLSYSNLRLNNSSGFYPILQSELSKTRAKEMSSWNQDNGKILRLTSDGH